MNFIKKILEKKIDDSVHRQFQKFSRGEFQNRALVKIKRDAKGNFTIDTSYEFASDLIKFLAQKMGGKKTLVKGAIISTMDLEGELEIKSKKQFQGVKSYIIESEMSGKEILNLMEKFPNVFFGFSFEFEKSKLKVKPKAPKSGKPSSKGEKEVKPDFCKLKTDDETFAKSFVFEKDNFKEANVKHTFFIDNIIIPEEIKKEGNFARMREEAKREGRILRNIEIDGEKFTKEFPFVA